MKKFAFLLLALLVLSALGHKHHKKEREDDDDDEEDNENTCGLYSQNAYFDLSMISLEEGAWEYTSTDGNTYYFNFCGDLEQSASDCDSSAAVCIKTPYGNSLNAGRPYGDWSASDDETQIIGTFTNGDACTSSPDQTLTTTIQLTCSEDVMNVYNVNYTGCNVLIQALSSAACPQDAPQEVVVFPFFFSFLCTLSLCLCCLTCCFRSRRARQLALRKQICKNGYQKVPQQVTVIESKPAQSQPQQQQMPYYYTPYVNSSIQNVSAVPYPYYQPPMNGGYMYPQFMYAAPQAPEATLVPLDFASNSMEASRLAALEKEDERLARELQEKYNQEQ